MNGYIKSILTLILLAHGSLVSGNVVSVNISKDSKNNYIKIKYQFEHYIQSLSFANTPEPFLNAHWKSLDEDQIKMMKGYVVTFNEPLKSVSFRVDEKFDTSEMRVYSPYLFFTNNVALYLDYFVPTNVNYKNKQSDLRKESTVVNFQGEYISDEGQYSFNKTLTEPAKLKQYVALRNVSKDLNPHISLLVDNKIPEELKSLISTSVKKIIDYYDTNLNPNLMEKIDVFISYDIDADYIGFEGAALDGQILLNLSGSEIASDPLNFKTEILFTIAHEAVHLWNGYMFTNSPEAPTWLYEGAADYVAYQTLTSLDLISQPYFSYFYEQQQAECLEVLKEKPLNSVDNTPYFFAAYSCGRVLFEVLSHNFNGEDHLGLLKQLLKSSPEAGYSVSDFLELIKTKPKTKEISDAVLDVLESQSNAHKAFEALITL